LILINKGIYMNLYSRIKLNENNIYLYHATPLNSAFKIQKYGLKTNQAIGADINDTGRDTSIFLTSDYNNAKTYGERKDRYNYKMLRVLKNDDIKNDDIDGDYLTRKNILPEDIQIEVSKGVWTPIQNYDLYLDTPEDERILDKSLLYK